jgi:MFS transporter, UMF1 family
MPTRTRGLPMTPRARAPKREIFGWAMFDFANQSYTLLIVTVVFGDLFTRVIVGDAPDYALGNFLWSLALSTSYLLVFACAPVAGAIMDHAAAKKRFLFASYVMTVITTALLYFVAPGYAMLGVLLIVVSNFFYSLGDAFLASFLPGLGPPEDLGKISGFGWALGYVGGMASSVFVLLVLGDVSAENFERIRWVGPWAAFFFLVAAVPTFVWVKERGWPRPVPAGQSYVSIGIRRVRSTLSHVRAHQDLAVLMASFFFALSGIMIIVSFSFIYGSQVIGWEEHVRVLMFVVVQISAAIGALAFGLIQDRIGVLLTYRITLVMWMTAIALIYLTPAITAAANRWLGVDWEAQYVFVAIGTVAGSSLGACQSATRTLVGLMAPLQRAAEFFGFWSQTMKLAAVMGVLGIGILQWAVGLHLAILFCLALFAVALVVTRGVDEARGRAAAVVHDQVEASEPLGIPRG